MQMLSVIAYKGQKKYTGANVSDEMAVALQV
jgi:hypothetical protein